MGKIALAAHLDPDAPELFGWAEALRCLLAQHESLEPLAVESARTDVFITSLLAQAMSSEESPDGMPWMWNRFGRDFILREFVEHENACAARADDRVRSWVWSLVDELATWQPDVALEFLAEAAERVSPEAVGMIGAGPLEQLLKDHASRVIERVEELAATNDRFREALQSCWIWDLDEPLFRRVEAAAGEELAQARWGSFGAAAPPREPFPSETGTSTFASLEEMEARLAGAGVSTDAVDGTSMTVMIGGSSIESAKRSYETSDGYFSIEHHRDRASLLAHRRMDEMFAAGEQAPLVVVGDNWMIRCEDSALAARIAAATGGIVWRTKDEPRS